MSTKKILFVVTSHEHIENGPKTGLWLPEFTEPYRAFLKKGYEITVSSIRGGKAPIDERSKAGLEEEHQWQVAMKQLDQTPPLHTLQINSFDALFLPGGHGTMFDLPGNPVLERAIRTIYESGKIVAAVCHGPAGLIDVKLTNGQFIAKGKKLTAFTNVEERLAKYDPYMPFLLESRLREQGALFSAEPAWSDHVVRDGNLITGQNPQSSISVAQAVIEALTRH